MTGNLVRPRSLRFSGARQTLVIAAFALLPMIAISILGQHYSSTLERLAPVDLTNLRAIRTMLFSALHLSDREDSWLPMREALDVLHSDHADKLYETLFFGKSVRFQYPPTSLLPLEALSIVGLSSLKLLALLNFAIYCLNAAVAGVLAWRLFGSRRESGTADGVRPTSDCGASPADMAALAVIAALMFYPIVRAELLGQIQIWIDALFTISLVFWLRSARFAAGICIGLICAIKPQFSLLLIWGLLWRQTAFNAGILTSIVPICVISLLRYGLHNHLEYPDVLAFLTRHGESFFTNNSVNGILNGYLSSENTHFWEANALTPYNPIIYAATVAASLCSVGLIVIPPLQRRGTEPSIEMFGAAAICTVVGSPVAWEHHYGILLPLYLIALSAAVRMSAGPYRTFALVTTLLSWTLVANLIPFALLTAETPFRFTQAHFFFGALLLLFVLSSSTASKTNRLRPAS
jgi:alpha-1,2-mannosyltransferase